MTTSPASAAASAIAIRAAIKGKQLEELASLLSAGANPNFCPDGADELTGISEDWANVDDDGDSALQFDEDFDGCYPPLRQAAALLIFHGPEKRQEQVKMMKALLEYGADIYALFRQPLYRAQPYSRSVFPGEREPADYRATCLWTYSSSGCWPVRQYPLDPLPPFPGQSPPEVVGTTYPWEVKSNNCWTPWGDFWEDEDPDDNEDDDPPIQYGLRSIIHSILEDGYFCQPIIQSAVDHTLSLNLEHRSPQGCTILLSACLSKLGADAMVEGALTDTAWDTHEGRLYYDPFPPAQTYESSLDESAITGTTLHALLSLGANPLATDNHGRNALHHLLEATDYWSSGDSARAPRIRTSLNYFASRFPALLNQPDNSGTYPLHAALRRLRRYPRRSGSASAPGTSPEGCILDLISLKGINGERVSVSVRDKRGNTALHYVADEGLLETRGGTALRGILRALLNHPEINTEKDFINARNDEGRTALELILDDNGSRAENRRLWYRNQADDADEIETEVLGWLDSVGVDWWQCDSRGRTLLHVVASHTTERAAYRCEFLLSKGVDPSVCDMDGETALDVAVAHANHDVIRLFESRRENHQGVVSNIL